MGGGLYKQRTDACLTVAHQQPSPEQTILPFILQGPPHHSPAGKTPRHPSKPSSHITHSGHPSPLLPIQTRTPGGRP